MHQHLVPKSRRGRVDRVGRLGRSLRRARALSVTSLALCVGLAAVLAGCDEPKTEPTPAAATSASPAAASASPAAASASSAAPPPAPPADPNALPPSDRVFAVQLALGATPYVLGADGEQLWAAQPTEPGRARVLWSVSGAGAVQRVAAGDIGRGLRLYVARGPSVKNRAAPLSLFEVDPATGEARELWQRPAEPDQKRGRSEASFLSVVDVDGDAAADLAFAYFEDTHHVRTRHLTGEGKVIEGPRVRMAMSRAYADVDGDGKVDEVVGRLYGEGTTDPGELRVHRADGSSVVIPADAGVRALLVAPDASGRPAIYFSDGWVAKYATEAKAQLKRARWVEGKFEVEQLGASPDEFSFLELHAAEGASAGSQPIIVAQGNRRVTAFEPKAEGPWVSHAITDLAVGASVAVASDASGGLAAYVTGQPSTRVVPIKLGSTP